MKKVSSIISEIIIAIMIGITLLTSPDIHIAIKIFGLIGMFCAGFNVAMILNKTEE